MRFTRLTWIYRDPTPCIPIVPRCRLVIGSDDSFTNATHDSWRMTANRKLRDVTSDYAQ